MSKILNSQLLIYPSNFVKAEAGVNELGSNSYVKGEFAEKLLLYDRVIIPTFDFSVFPVLIVWLGSDTLERLIDQGAITFVRHIGFIGYLGQDGLVMFKVEALSPVSSRQSWAKAAFGSIGEAVDFWIYRSTKKPGPEQRQRIVDKTVSSTHTISLTDELWNGAVKTETYRDILEGPLSKHFPPDVELGKLPGIAAGKLVNTDIYGQRQQPPGVDLVLRVAYTNFELYLAHAAEEADLISSFGIDLLLRSKIERMLKKAKRQHRAKRSSEAFSSILRLNRMIDVGSVVAAGQLGFDEIAKIRSGNRAKEFRRWFHTNVASNPDEACREYVEAIQRPNLTDKLPSKIIRFVVVSLLGRIPILGDAVSLADSFVLDRFLGGYSPKFFIDELRKGLDTELGKGG